jgi:chitin disaccharide deacetylase
VKKLIVTGDDFGLSLPLNEAVEEAHRRGILNTASLMAGAEATADAVDRASQLPSLHVGLHLVLVEGSPVLPPQALSDLVNRHGEFSSHLVRAGINFFLRPKVRRQLEAEIRAQFQAFRDTGLPLDHVNTHHHMHLHPTVLGLILKAGREYGMRAIRLPYEPPLLSWRASRNGLLWRTGTWLLLSPWVSSLKRRLRRTRVHSNDFVFGMNDSGHIRLDLILRFLKFLPQGVTEIYFHPGDNTNELEALTNPAMRQALLSSQIQTISFSDL